MGLLARVTILSAILCASIHADDPAQQLRELLKRSTGSITIPKGVITLQAELVLPAAAHDLTIDAPGVTLQFAPDFNGRAAIVIPGGRNIKITGLTIDGNREQIHHAVQDLAPSDVPFAHFTRDNGILAEKVAGLQIANVTVRNIAGFSVLVSASSKVRIDTVNITDGGSRNARKRNNTTGGILLEEGTADFDVTNCDLRQVLGNGIWTHSLFTSPRNANGRITGNKIAEVARDAIQVGHGTHITVARNTGARIGYPVDAVEAQATPVAIDTAGDTEQSQYQTNTFEEVNGKCIDLDGFHDGEVRGNSCVNNQDRDAYPNGQVGIVMNNSNPNMQSRNILIWDNRLEGFLYSGLVVIGSGHRISHNHFMRMNLAHCNEEAARYGCLYFPNEPDILRTGIYLRNKMDRPAVTRDNTIEGNEINGYGMGVKCVVAGPGVDAAQNRIGKNDCTDDAPINARNQDLSITRAIAFTSLRTGGSSNVPNTSSSPSRHVE